MTLRNRRILVCDALVLVAALTPVSACTQTRESPAADSPAAATTRPATAASSIPLPTIGTLVSPPPLSDPMPDLLIHFHGAPEVVRREATAANVHAAIVAVNYKGMSSAYEKPFSDPALFDKLLHESWAASGRTGPPAWRRICVSSFSAGYGAVRALLRQPPHAGRIDAIYLADSLYAGWLDETPSTSTNVAATQSARRLDPQNIEPFRRRAAEAAAGGPALIITHGFYDPVKYAGTNITADDLIAHVGAARRPVAEPGPARLRVTSCADLGNLHIFGCEGNTGEDHGEHLRGLRFGFTRLQLAIGSIRPD